MQYKIITARLTLKYTPKITELRSYMEKWNSHPQYQKVLTAFSQLYKADTSPKATFKALEMTNRQMEAISKTISGGSTRGGVGFNWVTGGFDEEYGDPNGQKPREVDHTLFCKRRKLVTVREQLNPNAFYSVSTDGTTHRNTSIWVGHTTTTSHGREIGPEKTSPYGVFGEGKKAYIPRDVQNIKVSPKELDPTGKDFLSGKRIFCQTEDGLFREGSMRFTEAPKSAFSTIFHEALSLKKGHVVIETSFGFLRDKTGNMILGPGAEIIMPAHVKYRITPIDGQADSVYIHTRGCQGKGIRIAETVRGANQPVDMRTFSTPLPPFPNVQVHCSELIESPSSADQTSHALSVQSTKKSGTPFDITEISVNNPEPYFRVPAVLDSRDRKTIEPNTDHMDPSMWETKLFFGADDRMIAGEAHIMGDRMQKRDKTFLPAYPHFNGIHECGFADDGLAYDAKGSMAGGIATEPVRLYHPIQRGHGPTKEKLFPAQQAPEVDFLRIPKMHYNMVETATRLVFNKDTVDIDEGYDTYGAKVKEAILKENETHLRGDLSESEPEDGYS